MKVCSKCKHSKDEKQFYPQKYGKNGIMSCCKSCFKEYRDNYYQRHRDEILYKQRVERRKERAEYAKKYRLKNLEKFKERAKCQRIKYISDWIAYFKNKYSQPPICQICGKELKWKIYGERNNRSTSVFFDHKHNGVSIKDIPRSWYESHPCNAGNIEIWNSCGFGILCERCNFFLPTENRGQWFERVKNYMYGV